MSNLTSALSGILDTDAMLANLTVLIPVVGGLLLFAFTYKIIKKMITKAGNGKAGI